MNKKPILYLIVLMTLLSCKPNAVKPRNTQKPIPISTSDPASMSKNVLADKVAESNLKKDSHVIEQRFASGDLDVVFSFQKNILPAKLNEALLSNNLSITEQSLHSEIYYIPIPLEHQKDNISHISQKLNVNTWTSNTAMNLPLFYIETGNNQVRTHRSSTLTDISTGLVINFKDLTQPLMSVEYTNPSQNINGNLLRNTSLNTFVEFNNKWMVTDLDIVKTNELLNLPNPIKEHDRISILIVQGLYFIDKSSGKTFRCYHLANVESFDKIVYSVQ